MGYGLKLVVLFTWFCLTFVAGILLFTRGFLLKRIVINDKSECHAMFNGSTAESRKSMVSSYGPRLPGCWMDARYKKAVIIIIDALRYDFTFYNESLNESEALPYQNKLTSIHDVLEATPTQGRLYRFIADPPTTTMQRLKGLTTGSLPTFVDAGSNFASYDIKEDNIILKLVEHGKKITFMGDDTWEGLFPGAFNKSFPFPSFNVKDLHTVDNGVLKHLVPELRHKDWDVLIAHFLGVDHCGHRYGPYHPAMAEKLKQMDNVLRSVMSELDEDSILFVLGDHGMTRTGDHGGDSTDELDAALFVYTKKPLDETNESMISPVTISQVDLVPTISLLLGIPVPFGNLGTAITDLFTQKDVIPITPDFIPMEDRHEWGRMMKKTQVLHINAMQLNQYLLKYGQISGEIPKLQLSALTKVFSEAQQLYTEFQEALLRYTHKDEDSEFISKINVRVLSALEKKYTSYLLGVKELCQGLWAKFDLISIILGIIAQILSLILMLAVMSKVQLLRTNITLVLKNATICSSLGLAVCILMFLVELQSFDIPYYSLKVIFIAGGSLVLSYLYSFVKSKISFFSRINYIIGTLSLKDCIAIIICCVYCAGFFSNSYVVHEDTVITFLISSLLSAIVLLTFYKPKARTSKPAPKTATQGTGKKYKKESKKFMVWNFLTSPILRVFIAFLLFVICGRASSFYRNCREEQLSCEPSSFLQPLSALEDTGTNLNERFLLSTICVVSIPLALRQWLRYQGNLNGTTPAILCVKFALPLVAVFLCAHWALQIVPTTANHLFPNLQLWQQIILPEFTYWLCLLTITLLLWQPLFVYTILRDSQSTLKDSISSRMTSDPMDSRTLQLVFREMKMKWNHSTSRQGQAESGDELPIVYGLGTVYSSAVLILLACFVLPLMMVLSDGMAGSVVLLIIQMVLFLEIEGYTSGFQSKQDEQLTSPSWCSVTVWSLLATQYFYSTGHQATIPAIRFEAAFVGFPGDMNNLVLPGLLVFLNTFASHVIFALALPLLILWPRISSRLLAKSARSGTGMEDKGEFMLTNHPEYFREETFRLLLCYQFFNGIKVLASACSAALHRRHLMVWKIFAPRFVFEAASFLVSIPFLIFVFVALLRIDSALERWTNKLGEYCAARAKTN